VALRGNPSGLTKNRQVSEEMPLRLVMALGPTRRTETSGTSTAATQRTSMILKGGVSSPPCLVGATMVAVSHSAFFLLYIANTKLPVGTVLSYIFYWWTAIAALVFMKYREVGASQAHASRVHPN
jgi:hypothetical protein